MSETKGAEKFSARDSALGYLYQVRLALLWALKRLASDDFNVGLETLDDVVFESEGRPTDVLQAKHSVKRVASLTDASPDIWKTFRVWLTALEAGQIDATTRRILVSTGTCRDDTAAYLLRAAEQRNEEKALTLLNAAARSSTSHENEEGYALFLAMSEQKKLRAQHYRSKTESTSRPRASAPIRTGIFHGHGARRCKRSVPIRRVCPPH